MDKPLVNAWTEFGTLEYICVGSALNACYPQVSCPKDGVPHNLVRDAHLSNYITQPLGPRPRQRIERAERELQHLAEVLQGEQITVANVYEVEQDIGLELARKRSYAANAPKDAKADKRVQKRSADVCRPPEARFDHLIMTPWFTNYYQFGVACPRDSLITFGNTILETATGSRSRYFESVYFRDMVYKLWRPDRRIHWKTAPQPTCKDSMYRKLDPEIHTTPNGSTIYVNEKEVVFDVADMMKVGKDVFYKKSQSANYLGLEWLRREFPDLRFHLIHFPTDVSKHIDVNLALLRPPTSGSDGLVLLNQMHAPLPEDMKIFKLNGWKSLQAPLPVTENVSPVGTASAHLNMNILSVSPKCVVIEECEIPMYHFLEDHGFDVITVPLRGLNEFGGGIHCSTWDIRRDDTCKNYFPEQNYEQECLETTKQFTLSNGY